MIATYARANHPKGYGYVDTRAHGYVVLLVKIENEDQLVKVTKALNDWEKPFLGLDRVNEQGYKTYDTGWLGEWYGGQFDLLSVTDNVDDVSFPLWWTGEKFWESKGRFVSKGDNRFVGFYTAEEILGE